MALRELLQSVPKLWPAYAKVGSVNKKSELYTLVVAELPSELGALTSGRSELRSVGSTGKGNVTKAPWVAVFDRSITKSAQDGYYVVYLFSTDLKTVALSISFGVTQFTEAFGANETANSKIRDAVATVRKAVEPPSGSRLKPVAPDLKAGPRDGKLHDRYQASVIFSIPQYDLTELPPEEVLRQDFLETIGFYQSMLAHPAMPALEDLVLASQDVGAKDVEPEVAEFALRLIGSPEGQKPNGKKSGGAGGREATGRIGRRGEEIVLAYERRRLIDAGRDDLVAKLSAHFKQGEYPGWDLTSFAPDGTPRYIEVKSTKGGPLRSVILTANEWKAASNRSKRSHYYLCLVSRVLSKKPKLEFLRNPAGAVDQGVLSRTIASYTVQLG